MQFSSKHWAMASSVYSAKNKTENLNLALLSLPRPQDLLVLQYGGTIIRNGLRKAVALGLATRDGQNLLDWEQWQGKTLAHAKFDTLGTSLNSDKERFAMLPRELFLQIDSFTSHGPESTRATTKNNRGFCTLEKLSSSTGFTLASAFKTRDVVKLASTCCSPPLPPPTRFCMWSVPWRETTALSRSKLG